MAIGTETATAVARVYMTGDPIAIVVTLSPEAVLERLADMGVAGGLCCVSPWPPSSPGLPMGDGRTAYVRPAAVTAVLPAELDDDDE